MGLPAVLYPNLQCVGGGEVVIPNAAGQLTLAHPDILTEAREG
jgi:hypothetical protein